jgi:hypothetical protein
MEKVSNQSMDQSAQGKCQWMSQKMQGKHRMYPDSGSANMPGKRISHEFKCKIPKKIPRLEVKENGVT